MSTSVSRRAFALTLVVLALCAALVGCGNSAGQNGSSSAATGVNPPYSVASMKGATSIGLASAMQEAAAEGGKSDFDFTVVATADELVPKVAAGDFDFALVPANIAANLYKKTDGAIRVIGINTLGVLYGVTYDNSVNGIADLAHRKVYLTGKGSIPGYTVEYLLEQAGVADTVTLTYVSEPSEALAHLASDRNAVAIVPEPFATAALAKDAELTRALDMTALWDESTAGESDGGKFVTGVTVARAALIEDDPAAVTQFLDLCEQSVQTALDDPDDIAQTLVDLGILGNAKFAASAVPRCNIVCIRGEEMKQVLSGYLGALWSSDPTSVGGALPEDGFYYVG